MLLFAISNNVEAKSVPNGSGSSTHYIDSSGNVIRIAPKGKTSKGKVTNYFSLKTTKGSIPIYVTTYYKKSTSKGKVTVTKVVIKYKNKTRFSPYISSFLIEKKKGKSIKFPKNRKNELNLFKKAGTIKWEKLNIKNVQSVDVFVHPDFTGAIYDDIANTGNRYQMYTIF